MKRSIIASHCCLFLLICLLLLLVAWYKEDWRFRDYSQASPTTAPFVGSAPISGSVPVDQPETRSPCLHTDNLRRILRERTEQRFHPVPSLELYLFSAYLDLRQDNGHIVLIGTARNFTEAYDVTVVTSGSILCLLVDGRRMKRILGSIEVETGYFGIKPRSSAIIIRCPINRIPSAAAKVGVTFNYCDGAAFYMSIGYIPKIPKFHEGTEICTNPLPRHYNNWTEITEFVEHHRLIGARHFTFYIENVGKETMTVLNSYEKEGIASLVPWHSFPFSDEEDLKFYSTQVSSSHSVAIQECLYRRMNQRHPYLLFLNVADGLFPNSGLGNYSLTSLTREHLSSHVLKTCLRIRHHKSSGRCANQSKSQWLIRADAILSMKAYWIGNFLSGSGVDVPSSTASIRPLHNWKRRGLSEAHFLILKDRIRNVLQSVFL